MLNATMDGLFLDAAERAPDGVIVERLAGDAIVRETYGAAARRIAAIVQLLRDRGVGPGDRLVFFTDDPSVALHGMLAAAIAGATIVPLQPLYSVEALQRLVARVQARGVYSAGAPAARLIDASVAPIVAPPDSAEADPALLRREARHGPDSPYLIIPTSGSTGEPKLVVRPHRSYASLAVPMASVLPGDPGPQRLLLASSLSHGIGHADLALGLYLGAAFGVPSAIEADVQLGEIRTLDPTYIYCNPRVIISLVRQQRERGESGRLLGESCRLVRFGGAATTPELFAILARDGVDAGEIYSSTELGSVAITPRGGGPLQVIADVTVRIAADHEILVRTPRGMTGYYGAGSAAELAPDGFLPTGDLGELVGDRLTYLGRKHDQFNTPAGINVDPAWIEGLFEALPWVRQVVLLGDRRPYLIALIVIAGDTAGTGDGYLEPGEHVGAYERARADVDRINAPLEVVARVARVALFAKPFARDLYGTVGGGKTRRDRRRIEACYAARLEALYATHLQ